MYKTILSQKFGLITSFCSPMPPNSLSQPLSFHYMSLVSGNRCKKKKGQPALNEGFLPGFYSGLNKDIIESKSGHQCERNEKSCRFVTFRLEILRA